MLVLLVLLIATPLCCWDFSSSGDVDRLPVNSLMTLATAVLQDPDSEPETQLFPKSDDLLGTALRYDLELEDAEDWDADEELSVCDCFAAVANDW